MAKVTGFCGSGRQSGRYLLHFGDLRLQKWRVFVGPTFDPVAKVTCFCASGRQSGRYLLHFSYMGWQK